jgi:hypothetical protein
MVRCGQAQQDPPAHSPPVQQSPSQAQASQSHWSPSQHEAQPASQQGSAQQAASQQQASQAHSPPLQQSQPSSQHAQQAAASVQHDMVAAELTPPDANIMPAAMASSLMRVIMERLLPERECGDRVRAPNIGVRWGSDHLRSGRAGLGLECAAWGEAAGVDGLPRERRGREWRECAGVLHGGPRGAAAAFAAGAGFALVGGFGVVLRRGGGEGAAGVALLVVWSGRGLAAVDGEEAALGEDHG